MALLKGVPHATLRELAQRTRRAADNRIVAHIDALRADRRPLLHAVCRSRSGCRKRCEHRRRRTRRISSSCPTYQLAEAAPTRQRAAAQGALAASGRGVAELSGRPEKLRDVSKSSSDVVTAVKFSTIDTSHRAARRRPPSPSHRSPRGWPSVVVFSACNRSISQLSADLPATGVSAGADGLGARMARSEPCTRRGRAPAHETCG